MMNNRNRMIDRAWKMLPEKILCRMYLERMSKVTQIPQLFLMYRKEEVKCSKERLTLRKQES
jgi:hypothetical protein